MTSIVNWLRFVSDDYGMGRCEEAADDIERLYEENARLREALEKIRDDDDHVECCGLGVDGGYHNPPECCNQPLYGIDRCRNIARDALAEKEK